MIGNGQNMNIENDNLEDNSNNNNDNKDGIYVSAETISLVSFGLGIFTIIFVINCGLCVYNCLTLNRKYSKYGYKLRTFETDLED